MAGRNERRKESEGKKGNEKGNEKGRKVMGKKKEGQKHGFGLATVQVVVTFGRASAVISIH
jgi:hypothetical protein